MVQLHPHRHPGLAGDRHQRGEQPRAGGPLPHRRVGDHQDRRRVRGLGRLDHPQRGLQRVAGERRERRARGPCMGQPGFHDPSPFPEAVPLRPVPLKQLHDVPQHPVVADVSRHDHLVVRARRAAVEPPQRYAGHHLPQHPRGVGTQRPGRDVGAGDAALGDDAVRRPRRRTHHPHQRVHDHRAVAQVAVGGAAGSRGGHHGQSARGQVLPQPPGEGVEVGGRVVVGGQESFGGREQPGRHREPGELAAGALGVRTAGDEDGAGGGRRDEPGRGSGQPRTPHPRQPD